MDQYFTVPPHSIWNPYGMDIFHGFHMDSIWNMFYHINQAFTTMESIWNPCGIHVENPCEICMESIWNPYGIYFIMDSIQISHGFQIKFPHGFHMDSTWNPCGTHLAILQSHVQNFNFIKYIC